MYAKREGHVQQKFYPVQKQIEDTGAGRAALLHPYINIKGSGYRAFPPDH